jgi:hypothetical protein
MSFLYDFFILFLIFLAKTSVFIIIGKYFNVNNGNDNFYKIISTNYFIGFIFTYSLIIILYLLFKNYYFTIYVATSILIILFVIGFNFRDLKYYKNNLFIILFFLFVILILVFLRSSKYFEYDYFYDIDNINPFEGFGSVVHSFRAANISEYILSSNSIPTLNQNIGQSLYSSTISIFYNSGLQAILVFHLAFSLTFTLFLFYGFYIEVIYRFRSRYYNVIFLIFIAGTPSLGLFYSAIIDTESIFFLISNSDTLIGLSLFIISVSHIYYLRDHKFNFKNFILIAINGFSWNIFSSQNILLLLSLLLFLFVISTKFRFLKLQLFKIIIVFTFFSILGSQLIGGFLKINPSFYPIPGVMGISERSSNYAFLEFRIPRLSEAGSQTLNTLKDAFHNHTSSSDSLLLSADNTSALNQGDIKSVDFKFISFLFIFFAKILLSIKLIFFPIALIFFLTYCLIFKNQFLSKFSKLHSLLNHEYLIFFYVSTLFLFLVGVTISSIFIFRGYTFELSKFLNIGLFFMMFFLAVFLNIFFDGLSKFKKFVILSFLVLPSFVEICIRTFGNLLLNPSFDSFLLLFSLSGVFGLAR